MQFRTKQNVMANAEVSRNRTYGGVSLSGTKQSYGATDYRKLRNKTVVQPNKKRYGATGKYYIE